MSRNVLGVRYVNLEKERYRSYTGLYRIGEEHLKRNGDIIHIYNFHTFFKGITNYYALQIVCSHMSNSSIETFISILSMAFFNMSPINHSGINCHSLE